MMSESGSAAAIFRKIGNSGVKLRVAYATITLPGWWYNIFSEKKQDASDRQAKEGADAGEIIRYSGGSKMSKFLGPIHYWLYNKIQLQEEFIRRIAGEKKAYQKYISTEDRDLDELIDVSNIHGWLQGQIIDAETRYAQLVTEVLEGGEETADSLQKLAETFGREHALAADTDLSEAYQSFNDTLLDGMPCDRVNLLVDRDEDYMTWERTADLHSSYWEQAGGDPGIYYALRDAFIRGMLSNTDLEYSTAGNMSTITKENKKVKVSA